MSFLFGGRPQISSAEKISAAESEIEMVSDMFNRYASRMVRNGDTEFDSSGPLGLPNHAPKNAYHPTTVKAT